MAALDAATLGCPVDESLELVAMTPAELEEFSGVEIGSFPAKKSFEAPPDIRATPRCEAIAARGNPIIAKRLKHFLHFHQCGGNQCRRFVDGSKENLFCVPHRKGLECRALRATIVVGLG